MDYLNWELERQRTALRALLLGGGVWEEERRSPEAPAAAEESAAGAAGRYAGGPGNTKDPADKASEILAAARAAGAERPPEETETPVSAWEAVTSRTAGPLARENWELGTTVVPAVPQGTARRATGSRTAIPGESGAVLGAGGPAEEAADALPGNAGDERARKSTAARLGGGEAARQKDGRPHPAESPAIWVPVLRQEDGGGRTAPWSGGEAAALQAEERAKALSRAVQRDARRYDGGFNMY